MMKVARHISVSPLYLFGKKRWRSGRRGLGEEKENAQSQLRAELAIAGVQTERLDLQVGHGEKVSSTSERMMVSVVRAWTSAGQDCV
jgi:hypothetical protein